MSDATDDMPANEMEDIFLARQPILDRSGGLIGFELLFRGGRTDRAEVIDGMHATSTVVYNAFNGMRIEDVLGPHKGFVNVDHEFLMSDMVDLLPCEQIVIEVLETVELTAAVIDRITALRARGYRIALDDYAGEVSEVRNVLPHIDIVKVDLLCVPETQLALTVARLRAHNILLLAEKVETYEQYMRVRGLGFDLFQGYFFARPQLLATRTHRHPQKMAMLRLFNLVLRDAEIDVLEAELKRHPIVSYRLLRMVNSPAMGLKITITSLRHAVVLLGRMPLRNWMQLMLYSARDYDGSQNPLLQLAATRGKMMELMMPPHADTPLRDEACLVGILSLVDVLFGISREAVVQELKVSDAVRAAILDRSGELGVMLRVIELIEEGEATHVREHLEDLPHLTPDALAEMEIAAFAWANAIDG